jgi:predicted nucleotidyltransferase
MELKSSDKIAIKYHDIFDYKLTKEEAVKWQYQNQKALVSGRKNKSRLQRERVSEKKLKIAKNAAYTLAKVPSILFVGITGSLAMMNADKKSDIDLLIITKKDTLWATRIISYVILILNKFSIRKPNSKNEKDKLCLNMWLDEMALVWNQKDRNIYTAHEISQIVPLINKKNTYQRFVRKNIWVFSFWPKAINKKDLILNKKALKYGNSVIDSLLVVFEPFAYLAQYIYMKPKATKEIVSKNKAIFHKNNWNRKISDKLGY